MAPKSQKQIIDEFNQFVAGIDDALAELATMAKSHDPGFEADLSLDSLDGIQFLMGEAKENTNLTGLVASYLGEVFIREVGGSWQIEKRPEVAGYGVPGIGKIPGLNPRYIWHPFNVVRNYLEKPEPGFFRRSVLVVKDLL